MRKSIVLLVMAIWCATVMGYALANVQNKAQYYSWNCGDTPPAGAEGDLGLEKCQGTGVNKSYVKSAGTWSLIASGGSGSGGTTNHALLSNLSFTLSGHTGFASSVSLSAHISNTSNPHGVTASQVGADPLGAAASVLTSLTSHTVLTGTQVHGLGSASTHAASDFVSVPAVYTLLVTTSTDIGGDPANPYTIGSNGEDVLYLNNPTGNISSYLWFDPAYTPYKRYWIEGRQGTHYISMVGGSMSSTMAAYDLTLWPGFTGWKLNNDNAIGVSFQLDIFGNPTVQYWEWPHLGSRTFIKWFGSYNAVDGYEERYTLNADQYAWIAAGVTLDSLADVVITGPTASQTLVFDGANWVNVPGSWPTTTETLTNKTINDLSNYVDADALHLKVKLDLGSSATVGMPVFGTTWNAGTGAITVQKARANSLSTVPALCLVEDAAADGSTVECRTSGVLDGVNTSAWSEGAKLYIDPNTAGTLTTTQPSSPNYAQQVAVVLRQNAGAGVLQVDLGPIITDLSAYATSSYVRSYAATTASLASYALNTYVTSYAVATNNADLAYLKASDIGRFSSGLSTGGLISAQSNTLISIASGTGFTNDYTGNAGTYKVVSWNTITGIPLFGAGTNYVGIKSDGTYTINTTRMPRYSQYIYLGNVYQSGGQIAGVFSVPEYSGQYQDHVNEWVTDAIKSLVASGMIVSESTPTHLSMSSGEFYARFGSYSAPTTTTFYKMYQNSGNWYQDGASPNMVNVSQYNNVATGLVSMTSGSWKSDLVLMTPDKNMYYIYSQGQYADEATALKAALPSIPTEIAQDAVYLAQIVSTTTDTTIGSRIHDIRPYLARLFGTGGTSPGAAIDHGTLTGLDHDDHLQYYNDSRLNALKGAANGIAPLDAGARVPLANMPMSLLHSVTYQGEWDSSINSPVLSDASCSANGQGYYYHVSVASLGTTTLGGNGTWWLGDWAVCNGANWQYASNSVDVTSVDSMAGAVNLTGKYLQITAPNYAGTAALATGLVGTANVSSSGTGTFAHLWATDLKSSGTISIQPVGTNSGISLLPNGSAAVTISTSLTVPAISSSGSITGATIYGSGSNLTGLTYSQLTGTPTWNQNTSGNAATANYALSAATATTLIGTANVNSSGTATFTSGVWGAHGGSGANLTALPANTTLYPTLNQNTTGSAGSAAVASTAYFASSAATASTLIGTANVNSSGTATFTAGVWGAHGGSGANLTALPANTTYYPTLNQNTTGIAALANGLTATPIWGMSTGGTGSVSPQCPTGYAFTSTNGSTWNCVAVGGGSGAPIVASYLTQTYNSSLINSQATGSLATGIVKNATGTGILSIATAGTDYLDTTYAGSSNIATVGIITTGTWSNIGTVIKTGGISSNGTGTFNKIVSNNPLAYTGGGTGTTLLGSAGTIAWSTGASYSFSAVGSAGDCFKSGAAGSPTWGSCSAGGGYATIQNNTTPLTQRTTINCDGGHILCTDDAGNSRTNISYVYDSDDVISYSLGTVSAGQLAQYADTAGNHINAVTTTGIAKLSSGVVSAAVAGDFPTLNQNTTGIAALANGLTATPVWSMSTGGTGSVSPQCPTGYAFTSTNGSTWNCIAVDGVAGAPTTSKYITQVLDASLPNSQATGSLTTGILMNTTTTGVLSIGVAGTDYQAAITSGSTLTFSSEWLSTGTTISGVASDPTNTILGKDQLTAKKMAGSVYSLAETNKNTYANVFGHNRGLTKQAISSANGNGTTITSDAYTAASTTGTSATRSVASTSLFTRAKRIGYTATSATQVGQCVGWYPSAASVQYSVGDGAGLGGFTFVGRAGISDASTVANGIFFLGMRSSSTVPAGTDTPNTYTNVIGLCNAVGDSNMKICYGGSAAQTEIDLGANFPKNTLSADMYELTLVAPSTSNNTVHYHVRRLGTTYEADGTLTGTAGTALPASTTFLGGAAFRCNGTTNVTPGIDIMGIYIETDY